MFLCKKTLVRKRHENGRRKTKVNVHVPTMVENQTEHFRFHKIDAIIILSVEVSHCQHGQKLQ